MKNNSLNLNYFIEVVKQGICPEDMKVDLHCEVHRINPLTNKAPGHLHEEDILRLKESVISGWCRRGINIDLSWNSLKNKRVYLIAEILSHANRPENIKFNLVGNCITDSGAIAILNAIHGGPKTPGINIDLAGDYIRNGYGIKFFNNKITDNTAVHLANMLASKNLPSNVTINFSSTQITQSGVLIIVKALEDAIKTGSYPTGISLRFDGIRMDNNLQIRLNNILTHQKLPTIYEDTTSRVSNNPASFSYATAKTNAAPKAAVEPANKFFNRILP